MCLLDLCSLLITEKKAVSLVWRWRNTLKIDFIFFFFDYSGTDTPALSEVLSCFQLLPWQLTYKASPLGPGDLG